MLENTIEFDGIDYDARHGGPFDRGSADSYYGRPCRPQDRKSTRLNSSH